ncbi:4-diphosphocytidyl-2-C-methyl-D-erythritol kinase [Sphingomonas vulcanisoli]|uniref:4-diphosphocytidyl-2-C-methyl-D-erythritol kinase n=1 Tax=Sphingomonas vulcanisoli TaxID=1658060 RepID=A0ABX0TRQ4_9SPHN|nr:4-diphosphocytidyl-2-C-methyl-D-erythritol kinase [Sphingomonas vulcanisoli]
MTLTETAYAKINLALHVRAREASGYHAIETFFAFAEDGDRLTLSDAPGLVIEGEFAAGLQADGDNLVTRAAVAFAEAFGTEARGFRLEKALPIAAGIGGGSADAAAALRLLARAEGVTEDDPRLMTIAAGLGADVPACLLSRTCRGTGRGDELASVEPGRLAGMALLLVNPRLPLATGPVFQGWDGQDRGALAEGDPLDVALDARNDLEPPARALRPEIDAVLATLRAQAGVVLARMSGSGATCFALFGNDAARDTAAAAMPAGWWQMATRVRG